MDGQQFHQFDGGGLAPAEAGGAPGCPALFGAAAAAANPAAANPAAGHQPGRRANPARMRPAELAQQKFAMKQQQRQQEQQQQQQPAPLPLQQQQHAAVGGTEPAMPLPLTMPGLSNDSGLWALVQEWGGADALFPPSPGAGIAAAAAPGAGPAGGQGTLGAVGALQTPPQGPELGAHLTQLHPGQPGQPLPAGDPLIWPQHQQQQQPLPQQPLPRQQAAVPLAPSVRQPPPVQLAAAQQGPPGGGGAAAAALANALAGSQMQQPLQEDLLRSMVMQLFGCGAKQHRTSSSSSGHGAAQQGQAAQHGAAGQLARLGGQLGTPARHQLMAGMPPGWLPGWGWKGPGPGMRLGPEIAALVAQLQQHNAPPPFGTDQRM